MLPPLVRSCALIASLLVTAAIAHDDPAKPSTQPLADHGTVLGHGPARYRVNASWSKADPATAPVINSHAMVEGKDGLLYLVTDHPKNAFLVFRKDGSFVRSFGEGLVGGHGVDILTKDGTEYLVHVDCGWHFGAEGWTPKAEEGCITLLKTDGTMIRRFPTPKEAGLTVTTGKFMPCDAAITPDGNILVVDGYASDLVFEYTFEGKIVRHWGGKNAGNPSELSNAHGISVDTSDPDRPLVWVSSRNQNKIKAFSLEGTFVEEIDLPGAFAGQLFIRGDRMYTAVCWSKDPASGKRLSQSGFVVIIDRKTRRVISAPGGSQPDYSTGKLAPLHQTSKTFLHGHDLYVDSDHNIYVGEWNANRRYPVKLEALPQP